MRDWFLLVDSMLRPARPHLPRCLRDRERHLVDRREAQERATRAIQDCERQIVALREEVFAANDGFVGARMTDLERTWRRLSRVDPDAGLMDLWSRMAPPTWIDRKPWRGNAGEAALDTAVLLAADVDGAEAAERAARELFGARPILWRLLPEPHADEPHAGGLLEHADYTHSLLDAQEHAALEALATCEMKPGILARARRIEHDVEARAGHALTAEPALAKSVGRAAFADALCGAARSLGADVPNPSAHLYSLWATGYVIADVAESAVTLGIPRLSLTT